MSTFLDNIENVRKYEMIKHLGTIYGNLGDYRMKGFHTVDGVDSRFVKALGEFADLVEKEALRARGELAEEKSSSHVDALKPVDEVKAE